VGHPRLTHEYTNEIWQRYKRGETAAVITRAMGPHPTTIAQFIREAGGIRPPCPHRLRQAAVADRACVRSWKTNWPRNARPPRSLVGWPNLSR
jgi:hypothetical protein